MRARALVVCGAAFFSGCSLILAGDLDAAREIGVSPDASDSGSGSSSSGNTNESGVATEAGNDAGSEAGLPTGCAAYQPAPEFCDDFDSDAGLDDWHINAMAGNVRLQSDVSYSSPSALAATMNAGGDPCQYSRADRTFENIGSQRVTVTSRMRLQAPWPDGMIPLAIELFPNGTDDYCTSLFYVDSKDGQPNAAEINVQSKAMPNHILPLLGFPSADEWSEMKIVVTPRAGGGATYEVTFTDPNGFLVTSTQEFPECPGWANIAIHLGMHCNNQAASAFFDDVRVDWE